VFGFGGRCTKGLKKRNQRRRIACSRRSYPSRDESLEVTSAESGIAANILRFLHRIQGDERGRFGEEWQQNPAHAL
jgi:hypothetical protein